jgi:RNA polymerase-interacting CarD/CdnL/TRCF family regulator
MVAKKQNRFEIGDWIIHYYYGIGKVKDIVDKGLNENRNTFYKVSTKEIDYWIPMDQEDIDHIEPIRSKEDFENALEILSQEPEPIGKHYKTRKKRIHDRWLDGSLNNRAELIRDLHGRLKLEKLSFSEKEMFEKVKRYYIAEWIIADKFMKRRDAKKMMRKALKEGVKKAKLSQKVEE